MAEAKTIQMSTDLARLITSILPIGNGGTGQNTALMAFNALAAGLSTATGDFNDTTYFITTNNSGATNDYYVRSYSILKGNIKTYLTPNIITSIAYSGEGNAVTALSLSSAGVLTVTKGATYNNYSLPLAASSIRGGAKIGYATNAANRNYAVQLDNEQMYVNVPWTDHYAWTDITDKPNRAGSETDGGSAITADKVIHTASGTSYIAGAGGTNAAVYAKKTGSIWYPTVALQTSGGGAWQIGNYNDETLEFQYATAANINSGKDTTSEIYMQNGDTGRVMTSGNYSNWVPSNTGTGASGTWSINITGTAASATNATSATYVKDRTNNTATYLNYGAAGLAASDITWLTCWDDYELRAISKTEMANAVDSAHKWVRIGGDTMTGYLYSPAFWANQGTGERQIGVTYSGGNLYFWGDPSSGTAGIYDSNGGYVIQRETTYNKYNSYFSRTEITNHLLCSTKTAGNAYNESGSAIQVREVGLVANAQSAWTYAPKIGFHWSGRCAMQLGMDSSQWLCLYNNNSTTPGSMRLHNILLEGTTDATMSAASSNPRITFQEGTSTQPVHLVYTDYDSYRSPAGLKVVGGTSASPAWFEVEGNLCVSTSNTAGGGIILSDDGDIVDLNDGYCSMRFSYGVNILSGNRSGSTSISLKSNGEIWANSFIYSASYVQAANTMYINSGNLNMMYNNTWYAIIQNHGNGNIAFGGTGGGLYIGHTNTAYQYFQTNGEWRFQIGSDGYCYTRSYLNLGGGKENNASSPYAVWGSNSTDNFLRSYQTTSLSVKSLASTGYGTTCMTYLQTPDAFDGNSGWTHYIICNHGDGSTFYHYTLGLPFWGAPKYKRQMGDTNNVTKWYKFWTEENLKIRKKTVSAGSSSYHSLGLNASQYLVLGVSVVVASQFSGGTTTYYNCRPYINYSTNTWYVFYYDQNNARLTSTDSSAKIQVVYIDYGEDGLIE